MSKPTLFVFLGRAQPDLSLNDSEYPFVILFADDLSKYERGLAQARSATGGNTHQAAEPMRAHPGDALLQVKDHDIFEDILARWLQGSS